jgi:hypothetical protein
MAIWGCGLPACCCQPAVAGGFIYADLWGELNTPLAPQALFTQSSPVHEPLLQAFPFPSTLGEVTLHPLSQACVFISTSHGKWVFLPLLWSFPPTATFTSFNAPDCWACAATPAFSGLACLFTILWVISPPPLFGAQGTPPSLLCVFFCCYCLLFSFFLFFSLGGGWSVQGAMLIWPRIVCGSTECRLAHLVVRIFLSHLVAAILRWRGTPPGFSI